MNPPVPKNERRPRPARPRATRANPNTYIVPNDDAAARASIVFGPDHEPTSWLREIERERLAEIGALDLETDTIAALSGRPIVAGSREDRTCDRCREYVRKGLAFHPMIAWPRPNVALVGGLCGPCARLEVGA